MSDSATDANSQTELKPKQAQSKQNTQQNKLKQSIAGSRKKRNRKTMSTISKVPAQNKNDNNDSSNQRQALLTDLWKMQSISQSAQSKNSNYVTHNESLKLKVKEQIEAKDKKINEHRKQILELNNKLRNIKEEKSMYKKKAQQNLKKSLLEIARNNRQQKSRIIQQYGFFRQQNSFVQGKFIKQIKIALQTKQNQIKKFRQRDSDIGGTKTKQKYNFVQRYLQKQIDELNEQLKLREKKIASYKQGLKFAQRQKSSYYAKLGWPAVGKQQRFQVLQLLGSGGFGEVYKCYDLQENRYVALKQIKVGNVDKEDARQSLLKYANREIQIQKKLHHPHIAKLIQVIKSSQQQVSFVLQYCQGPQLSKYYRKYKCLEEKEAKQIIRQILSALKYMYELDNKIIHYDLKPSNIMFDKGVVKILDFGLGKLIEQDQTRINQTSFGLGTYWYLPPQAFQQESEISTKVDIWSVGVIFYQILYGSRPFANGVSQKKILHDKLINSQALKIQFPKQTPNKYKVSNQAKEFIRQCLRFNQKQRLSPIQAYQHQYFN